MHKTHGTILAGVVLAASLAIALPATAAAPRWYGGATLDQNSASGLGGTTGFSIFGGYRLPIHLPAGRLAVEAGYDHFGSFSVNGLPAGFTESVSAYDIEGSAVYSYPFMKTFAVYGRAGLAAENASATGTYPGYTYSAAGSTINLLLGVGVSWRVVRHIAVRAEYRGEGDIRSFEIGATYGF